MSTMSVPAPRRRRIPLVLGAAAVALFAAALHDGAAAQDRAVKAAAGPVAVEIRNFHFMPATLTVTAGTTVTWTNDDSSPHTVTDKSRVLHSAALDTKDTYSFTFTAPGEYTYGCTFHPMMTGKIVVKPAGSSS